MHSQVSRFTTQMEVVMFSDPITTTIGPMVDTTLNRVALNGTSSVYKTPNENGSMRVSHSQSKSRIRRLIRFDVLADCTAALDNTASKQNFAAYLVIDEPVASAYTDTQDAAYGVASSLMEFLTANTAVNLRKVLGSEI